MTTHPLVLIVEDDQSTVQVLARILKAHGFETATADTLMGAIKAVTEQRPEAVVLDLTLQGSDSGLDVLGWLRAQPEYVDLPVLILTGEVQVPDYEEVLIRRHRAYVFYKPQPYQVLLEYLRRLIGR